MLKKIVHCTKTRNHNIYHTPKKTFLAAVYQVKCNRGPQYIGETSQKLAERVSGQGTFKCSEPARLFFYKQNREIIVH